MLTLSNVLFLLIASSVMAIMVWSAARAFVTYRGTRLIVCPETRAPAAIRVDAGHAAISAAFSSVHLQLSDCSRWPERRQCRQECLSQVAAAPKDCLVRTMLIRWYARKRCAFCGTPVGDIFRFEHKPALVGPDRVTREWREIAPERLPEVLSTHQPVCWNCHIAETFRRRFPELVLDVDAESGARKAGRSKTRESDSAPRQEERESVEVRV